MMMIKSAREVPFVAENYRRHLTADNSYTSQLSHFLNQFDLPDGDQKYFLTQLPKKTPNWLRVARYFFVADNICNEIEYRVNNTSFEPGKKFNVDFPCGTGFMCFQKLTNSLCNAILWHHDGSTIIVQYFTPGGNFSHPLKFANLDAFVKDHKSDSKDYSQAMRVGLLSSLFTLMEETIADVSEEHAEGFRHGSAKRGFSKPPPMITVIKLRRAKQEPIHPGSGSPLSYRTITRGHWRNQPYGPGKTLIRRIWISSFYRGPEDAPFHEPKKVISVER